MALDVYVMPLWRFKAGDFTTPIEATLGIKPTVISVVPMPPPPPWYIRLLAKIGIVEIIPPETEPTPEEQRGIALQSVADLKAKLTMLTGTKVEWPDTGEIHYNKQFHHPVTLQAFAAWLQHRDKLPEFLSAPEQNYYKHPVWQTAKPPHKKFSTLIQHSLNAGYFLPVAFEGLHHVEPFNAWGHEFHRHVASTYTILEELAGILPHFDTIPVKKTEDGYDPVANARWYAEELQRICRLSIEHRLPVIFHG